MTTGTTDVLAAKLERVFDALDIDKNGFIEQSDFHGLAGRLAQEFGLSEDSPKLQALNNGFAMLWSELLRHADTDHDHKISKSEYVEASRETVNDASRFNATAALGNSIFDLVDVDDDGLLSKDEFARLQRVWGVTSPDSRTFEGLDVDGDGYLTREECVEGNRQYFTSENVDDPGSWFFGKI